MATRPSLLLLALSGAIVPMALCAQEVPSSPLAPFPQSSSSPLGTVALSDNALRLIAGREDTQQAAIAVQTAGVSRNSVGDNVSTGDALVADQAFQNLSGLSILNVNTGNNVAINAAMNVTISLTALPATGGQ